MGTRVAAVVYGLVCYAIFFVTFVYSIAFVGNIRVPRSVDHAIDGPLWTAVGVDVVLLSLFAVQHSVMARGWFKRWWTKFVPPPIERSTYVLAASLVLALMMWQWRSIPRVVWDVQNEAGRWVLTGLFWLGWALVLGATCMISHFHLFGLKQVALHAQGKTEEPMPFRTPALYRYVRHPLYLGFIIAFWSAATMTVGHMLFAAVCMGYILVAIQFEERDLIGYFGEQYRAYRVRVPMIVPWKVPRG